MAAETDTEHLGDVDWGKTQFLVCQSSQLEERNGALRLICGWFRGPGVDERCFPMLKEESGERKRNAGEWWGYEREYLELKAHSHEVVQP